MVSRKYFRKCLFSYCCITVFTLGVVSATVLEDVNLLFPFSPFSISQNESDGGESYTEGYSPDASSNEIYNIDGEPVATPALSASASPPIATSDVLQSGDAFSAEEKSTVTISPSSVSMPSMIITATKVTLGHRTLQVDSSKESSDISTDDISLSSSSTPSAPSPKNESFLTNVPESENNNDSQNPRNSRYNRLPTENSSQEGPTGHSGFSSGTGNERNYYNELEGEAGTGYSDNYLEELNEVSENLPAPMALINPNGEGSNPPLEEDFAEAFKKTSSSGKRRRFRGGRKNRNKMKKGNYHPQDIPSAPDSNPSGSSTSQQTSEADQYEVSTQAPQSSTPKFKRIRTTTQGTNYIIRSSTTTPSPVLTQTLQSPSPSPSPPSSTNDGRGSGPIVKNGPRPMILQSISNSESGVTQSPQLEKPSANTEKISTYFFSTPSPPARFRLRQNKPKESSRSTTTTTTTETPPQTGTGNEEDVWNKEFKDFHKTSYFSGPVGNTNFKIPAFIPMELGLESDDGQEGVENSLSRPDTGLQNKAYSLIRHSEDATSHRYEDYPTEGSSIPKYRKPKRPTTTDAFSYDAHSRLAPTPETTKSIGAGYYSPDSNTEPSNSFSSHRPTPAGSHYDRTKDRVIFYNDNPYSAHGGITSSSILGDFSSTPGTAIVGTSQTVGTHFAVSENPSESSSTHNFDPNAMSMYPRGQVYPEENSNPHIESGFKNGPPDSSHIHSPNMIEHSSLATINVRDHHPSTLHHAYPHAIIDHQRPSGGLYGTVEEVPAHGEIPFEASPHQHSLHSHSSSPAIPYPFVSEISNSPSHPSAIPTLHHMPQHVPPPSHHPPQYGSPEGSSFEPSQYDLNHSENPYAPPSNVIGSATDMSHNDGKHTSQEGHSPHNSMEQVNSVEVLSPSPSAPPPELPTHASNPIVNEGSTLELDPNSVYQGQNQVEGEFPPHAHTMAVHPDYEPANPPLPHDHPFHNRFISYSNNPELVGEIPLPSPEQEQLEHSNSIEASSYYPGAVDSVPTERPPFTPSPQIPVAKPENPHGIEFTPIPDDIKENELYQSYAHNHEGPSSHGGLEVLDHPPPLHPSSMEVPSSHSGEQPSSYVGPSGIGQQSYHHPGHSADVSYTGPVSEIHSGLYETSPPASLSQGEGYHHHEQSDQIHYPEIQNGPHAPLPDRFRHHEESKSEFRPSQLDLEKLNGDHSQNGLNDGKKDGKPAPFSNTPYVLMFPQLVSEEQMRPSPPSVLQKEIPVIQASSMSDFTASSSGERPPLGPGYQAVPVHPRDQMYQVLAKAHYDKQMDKYLENKKRPPSAIYTPYGILVPVGTNVESAASSMSSHNPFPKSRPPPKFRGEKSLLGSLFGSASSLPGRFQGPNSMGTRLNKLMEFEPAIDLLAEKLAMKLVAAQKMLTESPIMGAFSGFPEISTTIATEKIDDGPTEIIPDMPHPVPPRNPNYGRPKPMHMANKPHLDLKDYLKKVLRGQFHDLVDNKPPQAPVDENRRPAPMSLSSKLLNSIFRKGRPPKPFFPIPPSGSGMMFPGMGGMISAPNTLSNNGNIMLGAPPGMMPIPNGGGRIMAGPSVLTSSDSNFMPALASNGNVVQHMNGGLLQSASVMRPNKVLPPPGPSSAPTTPTPPHQNPSHYHSGIGHPLPPIFPQGTGSIFGSIKRLFNFGPSERYDSNAAPNFSIGGRNLLQGNNTRIQYLDGPSPRGGSSQQKPQSFQEMNNQHSESRMPTMMHSSSQRKTVGHSSGPTLTPSPLIGIKTLNSSESEIDKYQNRNYDTKNYELELKHMRKIKPKPSKNIGESEQEKGNRLNSSPPQPPKPVSQTPPPPSTTTTQKPKLHHSNNNKVGAPAGKTSSSSSSSSSSNSHRNNAKSKPSSTKNKPTSNKQSSKSTGLNTTKMDTLQKRRGSMISDHPDTTRVSKQQQQQHHHHHHHHSHQKQAQKQQKQPSSSPSPPPSPTTTSPAPPQQTTQSSRPTKLDMFQTLLGSTRSVLNYFKSEARKSSPTVLKPRSAISMQGEFSN